MKKMKEHIGGNTYLGLVPLRRFAKVKTHN